MNNCTQLQILALFITELNMIRLLLIVVRILIRTLVLKYCFAASTWRNECFFCHLSREQDLPQSGVAGLQTGDLINYHLGREQGVWSKDQEGNREQKTR